MRKIKPISEFGRRLKEAFNDIQYKDIAKKLKISKPAVSSYMSGNYPSTEKLIEISKLTGYSIDWLLSGKGDKLLKTKNKKFTSLILCGHKSGIGTSTAASYIAFVLALKGYKILVIDNEFFTPSSILVSNTFNFSKPGGNFLSAKENSWLQSDVPNIDIFLKNGNLYYEKMENRLISFKKSIVELNEEYDFVVCDIPSDKNPFRCSSVVFNEVLDEAKVIIPYIPMRSYLFNAEAVTKFIEDEKQYGFKPELLGLFISEYSSYRSKDIHYKMSVEEIENVFQDKMFKTQIRDARSLGEISEIDLRQGLEKIKKTKLFKDYSELTDEILQRINQ